MTSASPRRFPSNRLWIFVLMGLAVLAFLAMRRDVSRAMKMKTETLAPAVANQLRPGESAKLVLELTTVDAGMSAQGRLLEKQSETSYKRTPELLRVVYDAATPVVMGKPADIHTGGVVYVSGQVQRDRTVQATQIVVLTGYVTVQ